MLLYDIVFVLLSITTFVGTIHGAELIWLPFAIYVADFITGLVHIALDHGDVGNMKQYLHDDAVTDAALLEHVQSDSNAVVFFFKSCASIYRNTTYFPTRYVRFHIRCYFRKFRL